MAPLNGSPLLCPINATCIHCRIVPIEKLKTLVALERRKPPIQSPCVHRLPVTLSFHVSLVPFKARLLGCSTIFPKTFGTVISLESVAEIVSLISGLLEKKTENELNA
jgi:hypothetical protein